jgi:Voltage-dependent anion channel
MDADKNTDCEQGEGGWGWIVRIYWRAVDGIASRSPVHVKAGEFEVAFDRPPIASSKITTIQTTSRRSTKPSHSSFSIAHPSPSTYNGIGKTPVADSLPPPSQPNPIVFPPLASQFLPQWLTSRWFLTTMGTGIVAILLHQLPYQFPGLAVISIIFMCLNVLLFLILFVASAVRYAMWPEIWGLMLRHPVQSLFL